MRLPILTTLLLTLACLACGNPPGGGATLRLAEPATAIARAETPATSPRAEAPAAAPRAASSDTFGAIKTMVGAASCTEASQCRTIAIGARACGGPQSYMAWSTATTPEAPLRALTERYRQEQQAANQASGAISTCQFMSDPGAVCQANVCRLGSGAAAVPTVQ